MLETAYDHEPLRRKRYTLALVFTLTERVHSYMTHEMSELIAALEKERVTLEAALAADPKFRKLQHIQQLLALYGTTVNPPASLRRSRGTNGATRPSRASSKTLMMEREITELLREKVQLHRSAILEHLNAKGIMGGEKNPIGHLASFLSDHRHLYEADGRGNFRLRSESAAQNDSVGSEEPTEDHPIGA